MKLYLVVLCCVAFATTSLAAPSTVHRKQAGSNAKAKAADYQRPDIKHLCLKEAKQYNCRYVGCSSVTPCGDADNTTTCVNCETHAVGQSDVVCCEKPGYGYGQDSSSEDLFTPPLKVGTCDWDFDIFNCREEGCSAPVAMENGAYKLGTAWATCYMNSDAEHCGHPFCDRMVMSFQGGVYVTHAYSKTPGGLAASGVTTDVSGGEGVGYGCFDYTYDIPDQTGGSKVAAIVRRTRASGLLKKLRNNAKKSGRAATIESTDYYHRKSVNHTFYYGTAVMITGPVTITSMNKHTEYTRGMLEYTPYFDQEEVLVGTKPAAKGTLVKPHQYDIMLISDKKSDHGDYYKKEDKSYQPEYKPEYHKDKYKTDYKEEKEYGQEGERFYRDGPDREEYHPHEGPHYRR